MSIKKAYILLLSVCVLTFVSGCSWDEEDPNAKSKKAAGGAGQQQRRSENKEAKRGEEVTKECFTKLEEAVSTRNAEIDLKMCGFGQPMFRSNNFSMKTGGDLNMPVYTSGRESVHGSAQKNLIFTGLMISPKIFLEGEVVVLKGIVVAFDEMRMKADAYDVKNAHFFGDENTKWIVNGRPCREVNHKLECGFNENVSQEQKAGCIAALELFASNIEQAGDNIDICGYGPAQYNSYNEYKGDVFFAGQITLSGSMDKIVASVDNLLIDVPELTLTGYYYAQKKGEIKCNQCDISKAIFVGPGSWTLNEKACVIDAEHHLQCN